MAKGKPAPAPAKAAPASKPTPYPRDWGSMTLEQRKSWMKTNRPNRKEQQPVNVKPTTAPAMAAAPAPAPAPAAEVQPGGKKLVQIDVTRYSVRVGTREPVECEPEELLYKLDEELDAWEEQCQAEHTENADEEDEYS